MRLYLSALNPTDSVTHGFLPAAEALGWDVTILTDQPDRYAPAGSRVEAIETDVRDARAMIDVIARHHRPDVIFSNSDHIQAETALAAAYFGLPGKDWRACVTAKNKALTRRELTRQGVESVRSVRLTPGARLPFPAVVKPAQGVASEDVVLVRDDEELARAIVPGRAMVAEEYLEGPLYTLETLGDGRNRQVLGGFRTTLGPLPHFAEERLDWCPRDEPHIEKALDAIGIGFGACHTEYVVTADGPRIIEVNYRVIGDNCDLLMADFLGIPLFEWILRVHAGEAAPQPPALAGSRDGHCATLSLMAERPGTVTQAPPTYASDGLWHQPIRKVGDTIEITGTNRDYLGIVRAIGPSRDEVDTAIEGFLRDNPWVVA
ncbi:ATP-grasp domain-containing protein [Streptosporangiaceae bacterium NEAU-GS5]|nr:ATP-grasp domain-containing protein [Streptosporangiaceae bacterium NEAU-GS5]